MKKKQAEGPSRREALIDSLSLPKDILLGALRVTLTGSQEAWVENYKGIHGVPDPSTGQKLPGML